jgi:hypothetical protein
MKPEYGQGGPELRAPDSSPLHSPSYQCGTHAQFEKRLDDRWVCFTEQQLDVNRTIFEKIDRISDKLNWVLGGIALGVPLINILLHFIWTAKGFGK